MSRAAGSSSSDAALSKRKRPRHGLESETEITNVVEASSSLQSSRSKRPRVSIAEDASAEGEESSAEDTDMADAADGHDNQGSGRRERRLSAASGDSAEAPLGSQYTTMRDMDFEHLEHEDEDDMVATQRINLRNERLASMAADVSGSNRSAASGIIERITCVNFMCHTRLECELGPLLNFIVGENGSGKSAILTAITLCLGAKASITNRGGSLKNFIKQGEERGFLAVRIKNCGDGAYEHDVYGDSIIIERHFSKTGTSSFRVKSATERVISTKRADVDDIVDFFFLYVDNPLNVLSQDNARQFLNSSSSSLKYKFFIKGVQLEQLDMDYQLVTEFVDAHNRRIPQLEERLKHLKHAYDEATRLRDIIKENEDYKRKKRRCLNELAWSQVEEQERELSKHTSAVEGIKKEIAEAERAVKATSEKFEIEDSRWERAKEGHALLTEEEDGFKERVEKATEVFREAAENSKRLMHDERDIHTNLKAASTRVKELEDKIREEQQRLEDTNGEVHRHTQQRLEEARRKRDEIGRDTDKERMRLPDLERDRAAAQAQTRQHLQDIQRKKDDVRSREGKIRSLKQNGGAASPYGAYDARMPELVALIERDGRFLQKPVGPLGTKIRVTKPIWGPILERTFGGALNGFIVTSPQDQSLLSGLAKRLRMNNIPIFISSGRHIDTSGKEPDEQFDTILRVLEISEALVRDQLIINNYIEQVILVEDRKQAEQVMLNGAVPRNVVACLTLHDKKRGQGLRLTNRGRGNASTSPVVPNLSQRPRMKTDMDSQIAVQQGLLAQSREELRVAEEQLRELQQSERQQADQIGLHVRRVEVLANSFHKAMETCRQIEEELDRFDGADGRLKALQEDLEATRANMEQLGEQYGAANVKKTQQTEERERRADELAAAKAELQDHRAKMDKAQRALDRLEDLRRVALVAKNEAVETANDLAEGRREAESKAQQQAAQVESFVQQAQQVCAHRVYIAEGETYESVEAKLAKIEKQLRVRREKVGMSDEEADRRAVEAKTAYERMQAICDTSKGHVQAIQKALQRRLDKWRLFQRYISAHARISFIYLLSERGYRGKLLFDHKHGRLDVQVEPDDTRRTVSGRDTRTLSGGEKSFSSICLLLSIWEGMGSPLRCLDEFDVFMDNVNRDVSTNMLFIFITPNAIQGNARHAPDVKIIRLTDPRQRTLDGHV